MAKLTKSTLKSIVKECLVEILAEGIGNTENLVESRNKKTRPSRTTKTTKQRTNKKNEKRFNQAIDNAVGVLTEDNLMKDIFADTARTTLQEQTSKEVSVNRSNSLASPNLGNDAGINLDGLFDSASENWSSLAFAENKNSERNN